MPESKARHCIINFTDEEKNSANNTPLFILLKEGLESLNETICANEEELYFIYSLFNARSYICNNLELLQKDFEVVYKNYIQLYPVIEELLQILRFELDVPVENELLMKKTFMPFIRSAWADMQCFQPDLIYINNKEQQKVYKKVTTILSRWTTEYQIDIHWNENLIRKLVLTLDFLRKTHPIVGTLDLYIIAPSDFRFLLYKKRLEELIDDRVAISNTIYNSITEVMDDVFFCSRRIIVCDESLCRLDLENSNTLIFPISLEKIDEICWEISWKIHQILEH